MMNAAKSMVGRQVAMGAIKDMVPTTTTVNWELYNFPPCLNLFHFSYGELEGSQQSVAKKIYISWILLLMSLLINFIDTCILVGQGQESSLAIMYSIFKLFIGFVMGTYMLYVGYYGIGKPDSFSIMKFKVCSILIAVT